MIVKSASLLLAVVTFLFPGAAQAVQWKKVVQGVNGHTYSMDYDSVREDASGLVTAVAQIRDAKKQTIKLELWKIKKSDCDRGYGVIYYSDLLEQPPIMIYEFAKGVNNVGSAVGEALCAASR